MNTDSTGILQETSLDPYGIPTNITDFIINPLSKQCYARFSRAFNIIWFFLQSSKDGSYKDPKITVIF